MKDWWNPRMRKQKSEMKRDNEKMIHGNCEGERDRIIET